ncbi:hypothetical protein HNR23_002939 [Nocardiopsis mwathae]|uniref:Uncharacterized protein n=1 Tax=Nocardiopsis mwathae TaxID=1472723 RepID=A0A7X0D7C5_9ACTN|nr:hypothetical protein [Nocardiopsis mwathae]MBB6172879.1 hypothetical protein [Nocardiopsis mwathae]
MNTPKSNAVLVESLSTSLRATENGLQTVPELLRRVIREDSWKKFITPRGELVEYERFSDFAAAAPSAGLGTSVDLLVRIVGDDTETLKLLDSVLGDNRMDSSEVRPLGTKEPETQPSRRQSAALHRLERERPDLHQKVLAGSITTNKAMIAAGFRARTVSVPVSRPEAAARTLRRSFNPEELEHLIELLATEDKE